MMIMLINLIKVVSNCWGFIIFFSIRIVNGIMNSFCEKLIVVVLVSGKCMIVKKFVVKLLLFVIICIL